MDPTPAPPPAAGSLFEGVGDALRRARRLWWLTGFVCVVAAGAGLYVGQRYHTETWQITGKLEFKPPAVAPDVSAFYTPTDLTTLSLQLRSPDFFRKVGQEFDLAAPVPTLERTLTVTRPRDSNLLEITLEWANAQDGTAIVARLMQRFLEQTARHRQTEIAKARLHGARVTAEAKLNEAKQKRTEAERQFTSAQQNLKDLLAKPESWAMEQDLALADKLRAARGRWEDAKNKLSFAEKEFEQLRGLRTQGAATVPDVEKAEIEVKHWRGERDRAKDEIEALEKVIREKPVAPAQDALVKATIARRDAEAAVPDLEKELDRATKAEQAGVGELTLDVRESEFRVESPAQAGDFPKSNRKKLTAGVAGAIVAAYLGVLLLTNRRRPVEVPVPIPAAERMPVPWALPRGPVVVVSREDLTPPVTVTVLAPNVPPALPPARRR